MNNRNLQQYERRMQMYNTNTMENEYSAKILKTELSVKKLQMQNASLVQNIQAAEEEIASLRDTLGNIIPENEQLKRDIMSMKQLIQQYQLQSGTQLAQKQRIIEQLTAEIASLNNKQDMRRSDLSNMAKSIEEKSRLEEEIRELKSQKLVDNENYEKMLVRKDQIIKGMNDQYSQVEKVLGSKVQLVKSMEEQINYLKNQLATNKHQLTNTSHQLTNTRQQNRQLSQQVQKLTRSIVQINNQLQTKHQTSSSELLHYKQQTMVLKKDLQQTTRQCRQFQSENQSLYNQNQEILKQYQAVKQENMQQKQDLFTIRLEMQSGQQQLNQYTQQNKYLVQCLQQARRQQLGSNEIIINPNMSKQVQLKQHYIDLLQESRKQLTHNQLELKNTFAQLQGKISQLKMKDNEISQLKLSISNYQHYQTYFETSNRELQQDKGNLVNKLMEKDAQVRSCEARVEEMGREVGRLRRRVEELEVVNRQLVGERDQVMRKEAVIGQEKNSPIEHFYDCNNEKQLLHEQLKNTKQSLQSQKHKSQSYLSEVHKLKTQLQTVIKLNHAQQTSPSKQSQENQSRIHQLKQQNRLLAERLNERTYKLEEKSRKLEKIEAQVKKQYENRIKSLQKQIYNLTVVNQKQQDQQRKSSTTPPQLQKTDNLLIDDLDNQFQLQPQPHQAIQNQLNQYNQLNSQSSKKLVSTDELPKSKQSQGFESDRPYKVMYEELRVQNDSLQAHLERLLTALAEAREGVGKREEEVGMGKEKEKGVQENQELLRKIRQLERELTQAKQQLQRFQSLKQLLKLQKSQSKQKSTTIKQLQQKLSKLQKSHKQLQQDYHNLQTLNQQTNQKYKKTLEQFKKEMNLMNEQILKEKGRIDDKKKEMKRLENEYVGKISLYEDDNMALRSKIKKLQLGNTKLEERVKELQEEQIEKVIITRTQLGNYKQTEKRLEELQEQIHSLLKDKDKFITQKKSLQLYYTQEISLIKNNFSNQRQKLLRKITQLQQLKTQLSLKLQKTKQILQTKRKQTFQHQQNIQKTTKENYHLKLQLSSALTQINTQLVKNKALGEKIEEMENEISDVKMSYEGLVVEKSKNQREKMTKNGLRVELEMAYKQIEKLNDVLMEKEKQVNYYLTHCPTSDKDKYGQLYEQKDKYMGGERFNDDSQKGFNPHYDVIRPRKASRQYTHPTDNPFTQPQYSQSHYKSTKNIYSKQNDFVKETPNQYNRTAYDPRSQNPQGYYQRKTSQQQFNQPNEKFIGGFPPKYCTFAPQYHKI